MNKRNVFIVLIIIAGIFLISMPIAAELIKMLNFIAYGSALESSAQYMLKYPLNIVIVVNALVGVISFMLLIRDKKKE